MGNYNSSNNLCPQGLMDLTESTNFEEDEIRKWYREFRKDFPDGYLSIEQFREVYTKHFPDGDATKFAEHVFRTFDADGDRKLDFREFMTGLSVTARGGPKDRLGWAFEMYDIDESGFITKDECLEIVKAIQKLLGNKLPFDFADQTPESRTDAIFDFLDINRDNKLSKDEFVLGANKDPVLSKLLQDGPSL